MIWLNSYLIDFQWYSVVLQGLHTALSLQIYSFLLTVQHLGADFFDLWDGTGMPDASDRLELSDASGSAGWGGSEYEFDAAGDVDAAREA